MAGYSPLKITGMEGGLVQEREEFILPDDAYPTLVNAFVWRERIKRKKGYQLLGRLQRNIGTTDAGGNAVIVISPLPIQPGIASFTVGSNLFNDPGGASPVVLRSSGPGTATLDRITGTLTIAASNPLTAVQYFPGLPVMGIRTQEANQGTFDNTLFFDQDYCYRFNSTTLQFEEYLPLTATRWNAAGLPVSGTNFFWSTNYWTSANPPFTTVGNKLFWVTNGSGGEAGGGDPPRITDGTTWLDFTSGSWSQINATETLWNWLAMLPFRGRMVTVGTWEGLTASGPTGAKNFTNRIRWSTIGNPFIPFAVGPPSTGSWRDDIRGQGGYLDIPTSEDIVAIGFVRDNMVVYCERSTWQLRYTGRSIAPFQIERVNSELGTESTFSAVQFDTSLIGIGDRGIVECDSYKAERIDIKIPDLTLVQLNSLNKGAARIQGIRDFPNRLAYWTLPLVQFYPDVTNTGWIFPTARLVYNYENDSWAIFNDSLTTLGTFQLSVSPNWLQIPIPWIQYDQTWLGINAENFLILGGNQQGFVERLDQLTTNDVSLFISDIVTTGLGPTVITSPNHNMQTGFVIGISGIVATTPGSDLNSGVYGVTVTSKDTFTLSVYDFVSNQFSLPVTSALPGTYAGGGLINIRENFSIVSKKFNFLDEGQNIQLGYLDILMSAVSEGEISLNVYLNYDMQNPSNTLPNNQTIGLPVPVADEFFNATIPTSPSNFAVAREGTKFWQRVFCPTRANFLTLEYTLSNRQMAGTPQLKEVQIDAQVLWLRKGGRMAQF